MSRNGAMNVGLGGTLFDMESPLTPSHHPTPSPSLYQHSQSQLQSQHSHHRYPTSQSRVDGGAVGSVPSTIHSHSGTGTEMAMSMAMNDTDGCYVDGDGDNTGTRRVSFGPTGSGVPFARTRLSFSSYGPDSAEKSLAVSTSAISAGGSFAYNAYVNTPDTGLGVGISGKGILEESVSTATVTATESAEQQEFVLEINSLAERDRDSAVLSATAEAELSPEDPDHPHKLQRVVDVNGYGKERIAGNANGKGVGPGEIDVMSPIALAHSPTVTTAVRTVSRHRHTDGHGDQNKKNGKCEDSSTSGHANGNGKGSHPKNVVRTATGTATSRRLRAHSDSGDTIANECTHNNIKKGVTYDDDVDVDAAQQERENDNGVLHVAALLTTLASAYQLLTLYKCKDCIRLLHKLPASHYSSAFVQHLLGKAFYEMNEYSPCVLALKEMLRLEPFRLQGTETLSTALWHLKKNKELCALSQQVIDVDRHSPEAWCVVGNCFSLLREPDAALRFFARALEINKFFTYAHTLSGHEAANNEDLDKASQFFRNALICDDRHYSAWYGLGSIYKRQERYELAEYHFRRALDVNSASGKLYCHLGMALHAQNSPAKSDEAYRVLSKACLIDVKNPQLHFQRAHVLISMHNYEDALLELEIVRELAPREPPVYILLGQLCQKLHRTTEALFYYNTAMDLDPKETASLKKNIEAIGDPHDDVDALEEEDDEGTGGGSYEER